MSSEASKADVELRPAGPLDHDRAFELAALALGWEDDQRNRSYFRWKHNENPFGASPMWLALDGTSVVGLRTFLRWELLDVDGSVIRAVRAVDTATHPDWRGLGLFSRLTLHGVDELCREAVDFVFNTPNDQSRPGYLKMGWRQLGRVAIAVRPTSLRSIPRLAGARAPASKWSEATTVGEPASDVFADAIGMEDLCGRLRPAPALTTNRGAAFLAWRYGFEALRYRVLLAGASPTDGLCVFRVRRRGSAREVVVLDVLAPEGAARRRLLSRLAASGCGDYLLMASRSPLASAMAPLPGQGPILTWRAVNTSTPPSLSAWDVTMGDIELF